MKKKNIIKGLLLAAFCIIAYSCGELDYANKEYYKQEAYIINSESTSATERQVTNMNLHTFVDTLKIINDSYDMDTIWDSKTYNDSIVFKVGIGGSQPATKDIEILVKFDQEQIDDYNTLKNLKCYIPDPSVYTTNVAFDSSKDGFPIIVPKGSSSASLIFVFKVPRDDHKKPNKALLNYAIPLKIASVSGEVVISREFSTFMAAQFATNVKRAVNWSGYPIPSIPPGRYYSVKLKSNPAENTDKITGVHYVWKYVLPLEDPNTPADKKDPSLAGKYMVFGTAIWSWSYWGYHSAGWMWNELVLNDEVAGTYDLKIIKAGDANFPAATFSLVTSGSSDSKYDPKLKQITLHYSNVINQDYNDVLTYVGPPVLDVAKGVDVPGWNPQSWAQLKAKGYKYWVPEDPK